MSQQQWEWTVNTGNPQQDQMMLDTYRQQAAAQGMSFDAQPLPTGGYAVRMAPAAPQGFAPPQNQWGGQPQQQWGAQQQPQQPQQQWGAPQQPQQQWGAPAQQASGAPAQPQNYGAPQQAAGFAQPAMAVGGSLSSSGLAPEGEAAGAIGVERLKYLRKVYGLLAISALIGTGVGYAVLELMPTVALSYRGKPVQVPILVALMDQFPILDLAVFGSLFVGVFIASWVSKIKVLNVVALFAVAGLMGIDMAPMVFLANLKAGMGLTLSTAPVRDAFMMTAGVFMGCTMYVFIAKKDFSYLGSMLSMGFWVVFLAGIAAIFFRSEVFSLAVASLGALLSAGFILYQTSYIFKHSDMDDPVDDALVFLVQLRNLFMFLLRIFMSSRD